MNKMAELLKQKAALEAEIAEEAKAGRVEAVKTVRDMIKQYKITSTDLKGLLKTRKTKAQKEAAATKKANTAAKKAPTATEKVEK